VVEMKVTASPDEAVAERVNGGEVMIRSAGWAKLIVWGRRMLKLNVVVTGR